MTNDDLIGIEIKLLDNFRAYLDQLTNAEKRDLFRDSAKLYRDFIVFENERTR